jgi:protein SCO1
MLNHLPNIQLINENNETYKFHDIIKSKTIVFNMFYSRCELKCIPSGKLMKRVNLLLNKYLQRENIEFVSITLDSKNDTVEDINWFKNQVYDNRCLNWHFYTGKFNDIEKLRFKIGMYNPEPEIDKIKSNHSAGFIIFNEKIGFSKHTEGFDNPVDIARKIIQLIPKNMYTHYYDLKDLNFDCLTDEEFFENIHSMNSVFTVPFLPQSIQNKYDNFANQQRGFQYDPFKNKKNGDVCCSCSKK